MEAISLDTFSDPEILENNPLKLAALLTQKIAESVSAAMEEGELIDVILNKLERALTVVHEVSSSIPNTTTLATSIIKRIIKYVIASRKKSKVNISHT